MTSYKNYAGKFYTEIEGLSLRHCNLREIGTNLTSITCVINGSGTIPKGTILLEFDCTRPPFAYITASLVNDAGGSCGCVVQDYNEKTIVQTITNDLTISGATYLGVTYYSI